MKKHQLILSLIAWICLFGAYQAWAIEPDSSNAAVPIRTNANTPKSDGAAQANTPAPAAVKKSAFPKKIFSIATAFVIGTPVCIVRRSKYEEWYGVHGMVGDSESKCKKILAGTFWLPFAIITGTLEAPFDATTNGVIYPAFSKDQLSKGKLIQNN